MRKKTQRREKRRWTLADLLHEKFGSIQIYPSKGADQTISATVEFNAIAVHHSELMFLSAVGSAADLKVIRSVVNSNGSIPAYFRASGINILQPGSASDRYAYPRVPGTLYPSRAGYDISRHRLGFGQEHCLFVSRHEGFMLVASDESVWRELKSDRITTPVVREWLPYIASRLKEENLLVECETYPYIEPGQNEPPGCSPVVNSCVFSAVTIQVDKIVLDGLRDGKISIPSREEKKEASSI